jgi:steroid Delta-isomerase
VTERSRMLLVVQSYIEAFDRCDGDALAQLYADDATVEDPVGSAPIIGHTAIRDFYGEVVLNKAKLTLAGPVRTAANCAAFPFECRFIFEGAYCRFDIIDVFRFDDHGKIKGMQAFYGPENIHRI